jgi:hypothetical protein
MKKGTLNNITKVILVLNLLGTFLFTLKWLFEFYCIQCDHSPKWIIVWFVSTMSLFVLLRIYGRKF